MTDCIQDLHYMENAICMPMYFYDREEKKKDGQINLFQEQEENTTVRYKKRYAISDAALTRFREIYGSKVDKESIFYYLYAVLQSRKYIELYGDNLSKEMPRIPMLDKFPEYVRIGKELAALHIGYEKIVDPVELGLSIQVDKEDYTVEKMRFEKDGKKLLKDTIIFNPYITIRNIPERAYDYVINGKSAIEWIMERYAYTVNQTSGIVDNPNKYGDEKYIFNLLISVINVSIKTQELIDSLPEYKEI